jgi:methionyl-tRNA formyltransferase
VNIILAAEEAAGMRLFRMLAHGNHRLVAVLTTPPPATVKGPSLWHLANSFGISTWPAKLVKDPSFAATLKAGSVDLLLNVHSLHIIHPAFLTLPRYGAFNLHPGPLPRYAGINAVSWALYRGETTHGVTLHKMEAGIDTGSIAYQSCFPIDEHDTALLLSLKCIRIGLDLIRRLLDVVAQSPSQLRLVPQDLSQREYFRSGVPENGVLHWSNPAAKIVDFVRACDYFPFQSPWGYPRTYRSDSEFGVVKASRTRMVCDAVPGTIGERRHSGVLVAAADEWVQVKKLKTRNQYVEATSVLKPGEVFGWLAENRTTISAMPTTCALNEF